MKVLFDVNVPRPLRRDLKGYEVVTAQTMGCGRLENGDLIAAAEQAGFAALVTADRNIRHQQSLSGRTVGVVALPSNKIRILRTMVSDIRHARDNLNAGDYVELSIPG